MGICRVIFKLSIILNRVRIAIYTPYLDTSGGGERYVLTIAEVLSKEHSVDVLLDAHLFSLGIYLIKKKIHLFHDLNLSKVNFKKGPFGIGSNALSRYLFLTKYDVFFYLSDGSIFLSGAKKSFIHFQSPLDVVKTSGLFGKIKLKSWTKAIYNSQFTKENIEKYLNLAGEVIYPPVEVDKLAPLKKEKQILSVGFFSLSKPKKHDVLIKVFKEMVDKGLKDWRLCLAGGLSSGNEKYFEYLKNLAKNYPVEFFENISFGDLVKLYGKSSIYWHATGFGENNPKKFEHFGISTVEAMSAECIPVVINLGGQPEIIDQGINGFLWNDLSKLKEYTLNIIKGSEEKIRKLRKNAKQKALIFSEEHFEKKIKNLIKN